MKLSLVRRSQLLRVMLCCVVLLCCGACDDAPIASPVFGDQARLRVPLQVYPEQPFHLDATQSSQSQGEIKGYIFQVGDQTPALVVADPQLVYHYDAEGTYEVSVRLIDGNSLQQATVEVVACGQPLACDLPTRPCPIGYTCETQDDLSVCAPEKPTCTVSAECPNGTTCINGACAWGGPCAPFQEPLPGGPCESHSDCGASAFCNGNICEVLACDDACIAARVVRTELLNVPGDNRITGIASFYVFADAFFFISLEGTSFRHTATYVEGVDPNIAEALRPEEVPPIFIGTAALEVIGSGLSGGSPWSSWSHLDLYPPSDPNDYATVQLLNFEPYTANVPVFSYRPANAARFEIPEASSASTLTSELGPNDFIGSNPSWTHDTTSIVNTFSDPSTGNLTVVIYTPSFDWIDVDADPGLHGPIYIPTEGTALGVIATDGRYIFMAENRIVPDPAGLMKMGAARILQFSIETGELVTTWPSVIGATCAIEADPATQTLASVQYTTTKAPFLAVYSYQ